MSAPAPNPEPFSRPLVSIEFDDGRQTAYKHGLEIVGSKEFGWKPTQNIITGYIEGEGAAANNCSNSYDGDDPYMTPDQTKDWNSKGDIGSHTVTHPHMCAPDTKIDFQLKQSKEDLENLLVGKTINLFATPYCESCPEVVSAAKKVGYQSIRNCGGGPNIKNGFDQWSLQSLIVSYATDLTNILKQTKTKDPQGYYGWLILVWHQVNGDGELSVSQDTLKKQLGQVKASGITVVTSQAALNESLGLPPGAG